LTVWCDVAVLAARATALAAAVTTALAAVFIPCAGAFFALRALAFAACILRVAAGQAGVLACISAGSIAWPAGTSLATWRTITAFPWWAVAWAAVFALGLRCVVGRVHSFAVGRATGIACPTSAAAAAAIALSVAVAGFGGSLACAVALAWSALRAVFAVGVAAFGNRRRCSRSRGGGVTTK
jgi:hypothetical protein